MYINYHQKEEQQFFYLQAENAMISFLLRLAVVYRET
jgi:hypothetical protein